MVPRGEWFVLHQYTADGELVDEWEGTWGVEDVIAVFFWLFGLWVAIMALCGKFKEA
jgi:hypothetical protein